MKILVICALIGLATAVDEYVPHHVDLLIRDGKQSSFPGSGVIVSLKHVLTVAINIKGFVEWEVTHGNQEFGRETLLSKNAFAHPNFDFSTMKHNLGIIVLPKSLKVTPATLPVRLPELNEDSPNVGDFGLVATYHGLGKKNGEKKLTYGPHQVVENALCEKIYPKIKSLPNFFCALENQFRVCGGTQGSGFLEDVHRKRTLGGILSIGELWDDCSTTNYLVYLRISPYAHWIRRNTS
ncbi:unnamed protein product [Hermetia illucens]|uniref:Peptidase S1 domain-containing protein n=1 Tax=Hermetia illucens TaxID=343691 RepID=A0A7R8UV85_HERIL|nr:vitamin K-dependent protein C-like [Hermetia illucens]CAD7087582.1 unnamed protein product [Hermetia illucens]